MKPTLKKLAPAMLALAISGPAFTAQSLALLVGIGSYAVRPLEGPPNDVEAMRAVMTKRWGFAATDVKTLINQEATRAAILAGLDDLGKRAKPGDNVFIYFSGHGISALDSGNAALSLPQSSGALVPHDAVLKSTDNKIIQRTKLIVGRDDLRPRLDKLDAVGANVIVIADACYSGQAVRSINRPAQGVGSLPKRFIAEHYEDGVQKKLVDMAAAADKPIQIEPYPYKNVVYLSAAAQGETALDIDSGNIALVPTLDRKTPHGAMTDALLRVLDNQLGADVNGDGRLSYSELQFAMTGFMADRGYGHSPQLLPPVAEDNQGLTARSVFGSGKLASGEALRKPASIPPSLRIAAPYIKNAAVVSAIDRISGVERVSTLTAGELRLGEVGGKFELRTQSDDLLITVATSDLPKLTAVLASFSAAHRLRGLAQQGQRAVLPFTTNPADFGGNFFFGQKVNFVVRPDRAATLVVFNLDANGKWTTLYPSAKSEQAALSANTARFIPGESPQMMIDVTPPEGQDTVFAFAFDEPPPGLDAITGLVAVDLQDPRMERFTASLSKQAGRYTFARTELRAFPPPNKTAQAKP